MTAFGRILLICWVPITLIVFLTRRPIRRALVLSMVATWLLLPPSGIEIPGFPDYTKTTAASLGALLSVALFDGNRLLRFRPKWYDVPVLAFCFGPIASSVVNDLGVYDGFSAAFINCIWYGVPYFLGRIYLSDREAIELVLTVFVVATLFYLLPALWEIRMSPQLQYSIYGVANEGYAPPRYGLGYRPRVFLSTGLELGLWVAFAGMFAYAMKVAGEPADLRGIPMKWVAGSLIVLSVLTKSMGAIFLMFLGIAVLWGTRRFGKATFLWALMVLPLAYMGTRMTGAWTGEGLVALSETYLGADRAQSLQTRFENEDRLIQRALEQPLLGWGGHGRSRVRDEYDKDITLTDGLWVIYLGTQGVLGLSSLTLMLLLPQVNLLKRTRRAQWKSPAMQPIAAAVVFCGLFSIDSLLNSNPNPIYFMLIGGLTGFTAVRRTSAEEEAAAYLELADRLEEDGATAEAEFAYRRAILGFSAARTGEPTEVVGAGEARRRLGQLLASQGRDEEAEQELLASVAGYEGTAARGVAPPSLGEPWSLSLDALARLLKGRGQDRDAEVAWRRSIEVLESGLATAEPGGPAWRAYADRLNDLAWQLAFPGDPGRADPAAAAALAQRATTIAPDEPCYWNTLGIARLHAGDDRGAIEAVSRSIDLADGGNGFDFYVMAMACARAGEPGVARQWFLQGERWRDARERPGRDLERVRAQAAASIADAEVRDVASILPEE